jgi:signal transduction histidine kinase
MHGRTLRAVAVATAAVLLMGAAMTISLTVSTRGPGFSEAASVTGGRLAVLGPPLLCLAAALAVIWRHPERWGTAVLVVGTGIAWLMGEWDNPEAGSAFVFSMGLACFAVPPAMVLHLSVVVHRGWLARARWLLVVAGYVVTLGVVGVLAATRFDPAASGCCPDNLWYTGPATALESVQRWGVRLGLAWSVIAAAYLVVELARTHIAVRRTAAVLLPAAAFLGATAWSFGHSLERGYLGSDTLDGRIWLVQAALLAAVAVGVLVLLVSEQRMQRAMARVVVDLSEASRGSLRAGLAERLGDPDLQLAFPVDVSDGLVDEDGRPVALLTGPDRVVTKLAYGGEVLAVLTHRRQVLAGRAAVDDLVTTIHLGLEHQRLRAESLAAVEQLRASSVRLVETGDEERRRLERDLHDGAQQRLVGLALGLRLLAARTAESPALTEASAELNEAIDDLRTLARGLSPILLSEGGLAVALRGLAESRPLRVTQVPDGRFRPVVESTAYAVVDRIGAPADVAVQTASGCMCVEVTAAGEVPDLTELRDRATTLGGSLAVDGRRIRLELPL